MTKYMKLGNIKIGQVINGQPTMLNKLVLTKPVKEGDDNFVKYEGCENGYSTLKVRLPFVNNLINSFDTRESSFITINDIKYIARDLDGEVYAFLLENQGPNSIPVIHMGSAANIGAKLGLQTRALLNVFVMNDTDDDFLGGKLGTFTFKTSSANSLYEIQNALNSVSHISPDILRLASFTLEVTSKKSSNSDVGEVTYVRLLPPSLKAIAAAAKTAKESPEVLNYLSQMEANIQESFAMSTQNAVSISEAKKMFKGEWCVKIETDDEQGSVGVTQRIKETKAKIKEIGESKKKAVTAKDLGVIAFKRIEDNANQTVQNDVVSELHASFSNLPLQMLSSLVTNYGEKRAREMVGKSNNNLKNMIEIITQTPAPESA